MNHRMILRCLGVLGAAALAAVLTLPATAQPTQLRVVQSSDGTLYLVQGGNAWPLVPDQIDDSELAGLNVGSEVTGALPIGLLSSNEPATSAPVAAPPEAPQAAEAGPPAETAPPSEAVPAQAVPARAVKADPPPAAVPVTPVPATGTARRSAAGTGATPTPAAGASTKATPDGQPTPVPLAK